MKRLIAAAGIVSLLLLSGCTAFNPFAVHVTQPVNAVMVYQLGNTYGTAKALAVGYAALPLCPPAVQINVTDVCHDKTLLKAIAADVHAADSAYAAVVEFVRTNPAGTSLGFGQLFDTAKQAITVLVSIEQQYNIGGPR